MTAASTTPVVFSLLLILALPTTGTAGEQQGALHLSAQYLHSSGSYGLDRDTTIDSATVNLDYFRGPWFFRLSIPYVRIKGFGTVTLGARGPLQVSQTMGQRMAGTPDTGMPSSGRHEHGMMAGDGRAGLGDHTMGNMASNSTMAASAVSRTSESGPGDITIEVGYGFYPLYPKRLLLETRALVKLPTADEDKGLGTGETDAGIQLELKQPLGAFIPFLAAGYTLNGDPDTVDYNNTWDVSAGGIYTVNPDLSAVLTYEFRSKATDAAEDLQELSLECSRRFPTDWTVSLLGAAGLSDAAPDWTAGLTVRLSF